MDDVIIIGAGPAGLSCAKHLKREGFSVKILEEHKEVGLPVQCSGLVSWNLKKFVKIDKKIVERIVNKALIHSPSGHVLEIEKRKPVYVIDRNEFDKSLSIGLEEEVLLDTKVNSIDFRKDHVLLKTKRGDFKTKMVVGADGPSSLVGRYFNGVPEIKTGLIAITNEKSVNNNVNLFYDRKITENFLWKIPRKNGTEYGMMGFNCKMSDLKSFFGLKDFKMSAGLIPCKPARRTYFNNCLLLGDAAGQTKPWSGGGVIYSLLCSEIAASVITEASDKNDFSSVFLKKYEEEWKKAIMNQILVGDLWNRFLEKSNNYLLDLFFHSARFLKWDFLDMDFLFNYSSKG